MVISWNRKCACIRVCNQNKLGANYLLELLPNIYDGTLILAQSLGLIIMRGRCISGHVVRESFWGLDKLREVRHFVSLGAELLEAGEL